MKNSQRAGSQDDRAGTGWIRRWWTGDKLSVRLSEVAFVLVLTGALACMSGSRPLSSLPRGPRCGGFHRRRRRSCLREAAVSDVTIPLTGSAGAAGLAAASPRDRAGGGRGGRGRCARRWFRLPFRTR